MLLTINLVQKKGNAMKLKILAVAMTLAVSANAQATTYTINATGIGSFLDSATYGGTFDLNSVLTPGTNYQIDSATLSFSFADNTDTQVTTTNTITNSLSSYVAGTQTYDGSNYHTPYTRTQLDTSNTSTGGASETASVSVGTGNQFFGSQGTTAQNILTSSSTSTSQINDGSNGYGGYSYNYYYGCGNYTCTGTAWVAGSYQDYFTNKTTNSYSYNTDATGTFQVSGDLASLAGAYNELQTNKVLPFKIAMAGNANMTAATLTFNVLAVPEPDTYAMLMAGIGLIGFMKRIQKKQVKA
jgi:ribosomal protein S11